MTAAFDDVITIARYLIKHADAGHDETDPEALIDVRTIRTNADRVLDPIDAADPADELSERALLVRIGRLLAQQGQRMEHLVSVLGDQVAAAATSTGQAANDAANRVIDYVNANNVIVAELQAKAAADAEAIAALQAQIDAGVITPEAAQAVVDSLAATNTRLGDLDSNPLTPI